jgi:flagellar hook-associated protein 1 FlgK
MNLFSYFELGRKSMIASQLGLQVAGDNIANAATPGYAKRRLELTPSYAVRVPGGWLDQGVDVERLHRMEDLFLQASIGREQGALGESDERLRGLQDVQGIYGTLDSITIAQSLDAFEAAFLALSAKPEDGGARQGAVSAASALAGSIRDAYARLESLRSQKDQEVGGTVGRVNSLAAELASLNRQISEAEADGGVAAPLRDQREMVLAELSDLTGGLASKAPDGKVRFELPSGSTLVTGESALPLSTARATDGTLRILSHDGTDITDRFRGGRLGAFLLVRDDSIPGELATLDAIAADLTTRVNALTVSATDLAGNPGGPLFVPDPPATTGAARSISVSAAILADPSLLAISASGAPGDGSVASDIAGVTDAPSVALGGKGMSAFLADSMTALGNAVAQADVDLGVSTGIVNGLLTQRDSVSGVSLDEEAIELIKNQRSFEAAAQFLAVLDEITATAVHMFER